MAVFTCKGGATDRSGSCAAGPIQITEQISSGVGTFNRQNVANLCQINLKLGKSSAAATNVACDYELAATEASRLHSAHLLPVLETVNFRTQTAKDLGREREHSFWQPLPQVSAWPVNSAP